MEPYKQISHRALCWAVACMAAASSYAIAAQTASSEARIEAKANDLLRRMTLQEKIGQLTQAGGLALTKDTPKPEDLIRKG
jgi:hypothetical protein